MFVSVHHILLIVYDLREDLLMSIPFFYVNNNMVICNPERRSRNALLCFKEKHFAVTVRWNNFKAFVFIALI